MTLLEEVERSLRYWTDCAMRDIRSGDKFNQRDASLQRAANLATIALALRATQENNHAG